MKCMNCGKRELDKIDPELGMCVLCLARKSKNNELPTSLPKPTKYPPGSIQKVEVLRRRVKNGQILWHPHDAGMSNWMRLGLSYDEQYDTKDSEIPKIVKTMDEENELVGTSH